MANQVCNREEAKSVYPLMGIFANVAQVASGAYVKFLNNFASGSLHTSLKLLIGTVVGMSMVMMAAKRVLDGSAPVAVSAPTKKSKPKSSLGEGFNIIKCASTRRTTLKMPSTRYMGFEALSLSSCGVIEKGQTDSQTGLNAQVCELACRRPLVRSITVN